VLRAVSVLGVVLVVLSVVGVARGDVYRVEFHSSGGSWNVTGYIEFVAAVDGSISLGNGARIDVLRGDKVRVVVNAVDKGFVWLDQGVSVRIIGLPVEAIYVNGVEVAEDSIIEELSIAPRGRITSTLKLVAAIDSGAARLTIDGEPVIDGAYEGYVIIYGLNAYGDTRLSLHIDTHYVVYGVAGGVEWNGRVVGVSEFPFLLDVLE